MVGVLSVVNDKRRSEIDDDDLAMLEVFANQAAIAIENARLYEKMEKLSITDGLTGLYNHRYFQEQLKSEFGKAVQLRQKLSLVYMDVDNFKRYNDTYGHQAGDKVLVRLAGIMREASRQFDVPARYGGEEFVILMPRAGKEKAIETAEKIRSELENSAFETGERITVSCGVSGYPDDADSRHEIVRLADENLYMAKRSGKNRVSAKPALSEI